MSALSIRNVRKSYPNGVTALHGIDLDIEQGDFFALLGPNGAGKSTAINIVSSLATKTEGSVTVFGYDLDRQAAKAKSCIGLAPQEFNFNQFETVENIVLNQAGYYGMKKNKARVESERCLRQLSLWDRRHTVSRRLSGGMKRRLMIAKALVHSPRLLILDEPTAGVDIEIRRSLWDTLQTINRQGTTIVLTTHYLEEAESLCRHVAIIDRGRIVERSSVGKLVAQVDCNHYLLTLARPLFALPAIAGFRLALQDPRTLVASVPQRNSLSELFRHLMRERIEVVSLKNQTNRLEQRFMDLINE